jgi:hypothetical protein
MSLVSLLQRLSLKQVFHRAASDGWMLDVFEGSWHGRKEYWNIEV